MAKDKIFDLKENLEKCSKIVGGAKPVAPSLYNSNPWNIYKHTLKTDRNENKQPENTTPKFFLQIHWKDNLPKTEDETEDEIVTCQKLSTVCHLVQQLPINGVISIFLVREEELMPLPICEITHFPSDVNPNLSGGFGVTKNFADTDISRILDCLKDRLFIYE